MRPNHGMHQTSGPVTALAVNGCLCRSPGDARAAPDPAETPMCYLLTIQCLGSDKRRPPVPSDASRSTPTP